LKEEKTAVIAEESLPDQYGSEIQEFSEQSPPLRHRHRRRKLKRRHSANRDVPVSRSAKFEINPPPRNSHPAFCSRSEMICAELLKRFIPHFELKEGLTFQVAIGSDGRGNTYSVDFLVDGVLFEYHPVRFYKNRKGFGDFSGREEYCSYTRAIHSLKGESKRFLHEAMEMRLKANYFRKRRSLLDQHPLFRRMELVVATSPEEFFHLIIRRFGWNYPASAESFIRLFEDLNRTLPDRAS